MANWKAIADYPNYEVSTEGQVKNIITGHVLKPYSSRVKNSSMGYLKVKLTNKAGAKQFYVHRLVAEAFLERKEGQEQVNHIDENKLNNNVTNLEWCTRSENCRHGSAQQRRVQSYRKNFNKGIIQYDLDMNQVARYNGVMHAVEKNPGFTAGGLVNVLNDKGVKTYKGFIWRHEDKNE